MDDPNFVTPDGSALRIWKAPAKNPAASERAGRPLFDEVTYVEVISPGSLGSSPVFELERVFHESVGLPPYRNPEQYERFAGQLKAFNENTAAADMTGTPLKEWPEISSTMAASLNAQGVYTVEALAALADNRLGVVGPDGRTWRTKAEAWLASTKDGGAAARYAAELERANEKNERLEAELQRLSATVAALTSDASGGPQSDPLGGQTPPPAPLPPAQAQTGSTDPLAAPGDALVPAPSSPGLGAII